MSVFSVSHRLAPAGTLLLSMALPWVPAHGQDVSPALKDAYFRAVARHFEVPVEEVAILGEWDLETDEIPVVLFISSKAGVSPDVLVGQRRSGRSWRDVAQRSGIGTRSFHVALPPDAPVGILSRAYSEFRTRSAGEWDRILLEDQDIVCLVNMRVLSEDVGVPPLRVLQSREEAGSFVAGLASLIGQAPNP